MTIISVFGGRYFAWGSSEVDWCEANYTITVFVAEFWNTVSNVLFFIVPPLLMYLFRPFGRRLACGVHVVWALLVVVGLGSVYFHTTLSLAGQLFDEIAIIWVVMAALALWYPKRYMPSCFRGNRGRFQTMMLFLTLLSSALACVFPVINCIVLFLLAVPATTLMILQMRRCETRRVYLMCVRCSVLWVLALAAWLSDRLFCPFWLAIAFPYLHGVWHICILLVAVHACILSAYFYALEEAPGARPTLHFWPGDDWQRTGLPYIRLHGDSLPQAGRGKAF